jgi:hypothetical protein
LTYKDREMGEIDNIAVGLVYNETGKHVEDNSV